jgi:hypothetical protein
VNWEHHLTIAALVLVGMALWAEVVWLTVYVAGIAWKRGRGSFIVVNVYADRASGTMPRANEEG